MAERRLESVMLGEVGNAGAVRAELGIRRWWGLAWLI